jgi:hypothetical protein
MMGRSIATYKNEEGTDVDIKETVTEVPVQNQGPASSVYFDIKVEDGSIRRVTINIDSMNELSLTVGPP